MKASEISETKILNEATLRVTCALIFHEGKVLATQRGIEMSNAGLWEFPGGKVEVNESDEGCIQREIHEELSIEIEIVSKLESVYSKTAGNRILELIPFICKKNSGEIELKEHQNFEWCSKERIAFLNWSEADQALISQLSADKFNFNH